MMRVFKHIVNGVVWTVVSLYLIIVILTHLPFVQNAIGNAVETALTEKFGTKATVGKVNLGFLNRVIVDDFCLYDQQKKPMIKASRLSVNIDFYRLLTQRKVHIAAAQIFGLRSTLYRSDLNSPLNCQFALDSLASKDTTRHTALDVAIRSLVVRNGEIKYDCLSEAPTHGRFNRHHLALSNISAHILLPRLTNNALQLNVKRLALKEASGLELSDLHFKLNADRKQALLKQFELSLPHSSLTVDSIQATYAFNNGQFDKNSLTYKGNISRAKIVLADIACFLPTLKTAYSPLFAHVDFAGTVSTLHVNQLDLRTANNEMSVSVAGALQRKNGLTWRAQIDECRANAQMIDFICNNFKAIQINIPDKIRQLGSIAFTGNSSGNKEQIALNGLLSTDAGKQKIDVSFGNGLLQGHVETEQFDLNRLTNDPRWGYITANLDIMGRIPNGKLQLNNKQLYLKAKGIVSKIDYQGYTFHDINIDGELCEGIASGMVSINDAKVEITLEGDYQQENGTHTAHLTAEMQHFDPTALKFSMPWKDATINGKLTADVSGNTPKDLLGTIILQDFTIASAENVYAINRLNLVAKEENAQRRLHMESDFGEAEIVGKVDYTSILQSVNNIVARRLPTLPLLQKVSASRQNNFQLNATLRKSDWLNMFFNVPLQLDEPLTIKGTLDDEHDRLTLDLNAPQFNYDGNTYKNSQIQLTTQSNQVHPSIYSNIETIKIMGDGKPMDIHLIADAADNKLKTLLSWNNNAEKSFKGEFSSSTDFFVNETGKPTAHVQIHPSDIQVNDTLWHVQPSDIVYSDKSLLIDHFAIEHNKQHIIVSGKATKATEDELTVDLKDVDVSYITNLVNFHAVEFSGYATGKGKVRGLFSTPEASAQLQVNGFQLEGGRLGTLFADVVWNNEEKQIDINAHADDDNHATTLVKGYVSPAKHFIDLNIRAIHTRVEFLQSFCSSFMDHVDGYADGEVQLAGDLSYINLTGQLVANGAFSVTPLNTRYTMRNDTVRFIPDNIVFSNDTIRDQYGHIGIVQGQLHHQHLTNLTYDLDIEARNLLCYDFKDYGEDTFFGTVYGTGSCAIKGRNGTIDFDINVTPQKGSFLEYNAASPDAITDQGFITWRDVTERSKQPTDSVSSSAQNSNHSGRNLPFYETTSDIHLNFLINVTPDATLRLLMDKASGDYISLNGSGTIQATYYNKGTLDLFGTYLVDHGIYKLTIQNVIKKEFLFQQGSTIVFGGRPYSAALDLKGLYTINGVSLSDLQIGQSFSSNNVRVDCLMNISGTPDAPHVEFDIDLPTVNTEAKQMVRSLINSEEEMNQQVIYLLSIGRFYNQTSNNANENQNQASLAMQSLLSGTISQQINNVLSSFINTSNWNFGANISTGNEGFNNAEYEGLLSGRLLNNRLLINGQFGYRDNANATTSFIGDFDVRYLLFPNGNLAIKVYNQTNDRYFTRNSLNTQGIGIILKKDFSNWRDLFGIKPRNAKK